jgi:hypothetical protein
MGARTGFPIDGDGFNVAFRFIGENLDKDNW